LFGALGLDPKKGIFPYFSRNPNKVRLRPRSAVR
jgi:hypothetical protein